MKDFTLKADAVRTEIARLMDVQVRDVSLRYNLDCWSPHGELVIGVGCCFTSLRPFDIDNLSMDMGEFSQRYLIPAKYQLDKVRKQNG